MFVSFNSNRTGVTCGVGTAIPPRAPEFNPRFYWIRVARSFVFCVMFCRSLSFCPFSFEHCIVCPCSISPFGIIKFFAVEWKDAWLKNVFTFLSAYYIFSTCWCHITNSARQTDLNGSLWTKINGSMTCICIYIYNVF